MRDNWKALVSAGAIMTFLLSITLFMSAATVKASQKVKSLVLEESISIQLPKKSTKIKHKPTVISPETSIKHVSW